MTMINTGNERYTVYKHTVPNGKVYIGITSRKNVNDRWRNGRGYENNEHFHRAIVKYGWLNIKHEILYNGLTKEEAEQMEISLIAEYKSNNPEYGYNNSIGGSGGKTGAKISDETRKKLSALHKGKPKSEEQKAKLREYRKGSTWTDEEKKILRELTTAARGRAVLQFTLSGEFICEYPSLQMAADAIGIKYAGCISSAANGRIKKSHGYVWKYKEVN